MEKITDITEKDLWIETGVWCDIECWNCSESKEYRAVDEEQLLYAIQDDGWKNLDSDKHKINGHWCGNCKIG